MRDDRKDLSKINEIALWFAVGILLLHFYIELHTLCRTLGWINPMVDALIVRLTTHTSLIQSPWPLKLLAGGSILVYGISSRGVKSVTLQRQTVYHSIGIGILLYLAGTFLLRDSGKTVLVFAGVLPTGIIYLICTLAGFLGLIKGSQGINRLLSVSIGKDAFNQENETFPQEERLLENAYSVNLPTQYQYRKKNHPGWINIVNPFRGTLICGSPGSGKSYTFINTIIRQQIAKGFAMYVYDFKFPDLSIIAFNAMVRHRQTLLKNLKFYCINFDRPEKSHRCNPLHPSYLPGIEDAFESAKMIMLNLNKKWIGKEGDFFVDTPIRYVTCLIWYLRQYQEGKYCTLPHVIELLAIDYKKVFPLLASRRDLEAYAAIFVSAFEGGAMEQLEGQMASARSGPATLSSPNLYWTMSANDFMLDINNPEAPKIVCIGNNHLKKQIYGAALSLYNARILNLINQKGKHPSAVVIDEIPTLFFEGISGLISTGRSNQIAVTIALQDFSQLDLEYGKAQADVIKNNCGTVISGQVSGATAEAMQNRLGKNVQRKENINIQSEDTSHGISTELNFMAPAAKITQLSQGQFVGVVADDVGMEIDLKAFRASVVIDDDDFKTEQKWKELPNFSIFAQEGASMAEQIQSNYLQIKADIRNLIDSETARLVKQEGLSQPKPKKGRKGDQ